MQKIRFLLYTALVAACFGALPTACQSDDDAPQGEQRNLTVQVSVGSRAVEATDGTPTADEAALHSLRVYAFVGGRPAGHYFTQATEAMTIPATFFMDLTMFSTTTQTVDFYVVANEAAMVTQGSGTSSLTPNTTETELNRFSFASLNTANGLPMWCKASHQIDMSAAGTTNAATGHEGHTLLPDKFTFELQRPLAKLGVFAAKAEGEAAALTVTGLKLSGSGVRALNYLMPQTDATLQQVGATGQDITLTPVSTAVGKTLSANPTTEERQNPANYTPVLDAPFYPFENPYGSANWNAAGDAQGNVLEVTYRFEGGEARTGTVYLPPMVRNHYYAICCLMNNSGKMTVEYLVADWDEVEQWTGGLAFAYPSYGNPVSPLEGQTMPADGPTVYYNNDPNNPTAGTFSVRFQMSAPAGQSWTPVLYNTPGNFDLTVTRAGVEIPADQWKSECVASPDWFTITVKATNADNVGGVAQLGISYKPTWMNETQLLLINGQSGEIEWPNSGSAPEIIEITQVEPPTTPNP